MKAIYKWSIKTGVIVILMSSIYYINYLNSQLADDVKNAQSSLEQVPLDQVQKLSMQTDLKRREDDIEKIKSYLLQRNDLVQLIAYIEERAEERNINVRVPNIKERIVIDPVTGVEIPPARLMEDLEMDMNITGNPDNIVNFLYDLEHSPYLLKLKSWRVSVDSTSRQRLSGDSLVPDDSDEVIEVDGQAVVKAIVTVWRSSDDINKN